MQTTTARVVFGSLTCFAGVLYGISGLEVLINGWKISGWEQTIGTAVQEQGESYNPYDPNRLVIPSIKYKISEKVIDPETKQNVTVYRQFVNRNYSYAFFGLSRNDIKKLNLTDYIKPDTEVKLYYDPKNPSESVVTPNFPYGSLQTTALGVSTIAGGITLSSSKDDLLSWQGIKRNRAKGAILGFSLLLALSSFSVPFFVKKDTLKGSEEERRKRWVDPYIVTEK